MTALLTVSMLLLLGAFVVTVMAGAGRAPLWVAVLLLCVLELFQVLPIR